MIKNILVSALVAIVISVASVSFLGDRFSGVTHLSGLSVGSDGFEVTDGGAIALGSGNITTSGELTVTGSTTVDKFTEGGGVYATSTAGNSTLTIDAIDTENVIQHTLTGGAGTLTMMASSSLSQMIPNAGDSMEFTIYNASTSVNAILTLAGNTGITTKRVASSTLTVIGDTDGLNHFRVRLERIATGGNILMDVAKYED